MSRASGVLLATGALALASCGTPAAKADAAGPARRPSHVAAEVAQVWASQAPQLARTPATTGRAQLTTVTELPAARFEVPQVVLPNAAASRRINTVLVQLLFADVEPGHPRPRDAAQAIEQAAAEYEANDQVGIFGTSFEVLCNQQNVLSLALTTEYSGAYPWLATQHATFDLRTGRRLALTDLLADTLALRRRWHARLTRRLAAYQQEMAREYKNDADAWATVREYTGWSDTLRQVRPARRPPLREFALTARGLMLYTSFWFPHAALALAPPDDYVFSYASLRPWLAPRGVLHGWPE